MLKKEFVLKIINTVLNCCQRRKYLLLVSLSYFKPDRIKSVFKHYNIHYF